MRRVLAVVVGSFMVLGCSSDYLDLGSARSALTLAVPGDYATIQAAIDAASAGDTIQVGPGVFTESLVMVPDITLLGSGPSQTTVQGTVDYIGDFTGLSVTISGFRFSGVGLTGNGAGILIQKDPAVITNNIIEDYPWHGIALDYGGSGTVSGNIIRRNYIGLSFSNSNSPSLAVNNLIVYNSESGIKCFDGDRPLIAHNTIVANAFGGSSGAASGGIGTGFNTRARIHNNIVVSNKWGMNYGDRDDVFSNNLVWGNGTNYQWNASRGAGDLDVDPRFADVSSDDFRLQAGSPAIDAANPSVAAISDDFDGTIRPQGSNPDLGAFEFLVPLANVGLVISEVMANPVDEDRGEFVEVYNGGTADFDLAGILLSDGDAIDVVVAMGGGSTVVAPGDYAVIVDSEYAGGYGIPAGTTIVTLGNTTVGNGLSTTDIVTLFDIGGLAQLDRYAHPFDPGNGVSAERVDLAGPDVPTNWRASPCTHSAGRPNCAPVTLASSLIVTEVMANPLDEGTGEFIELFNGTDFPVDAAGLRITDGDTIDDVVGWQGGSTTIPARSYAVILDPDWPAAQMAFVDPSATLLTVTDSALGNGLAVSDPVTLLDAAGAALDGYTRLLAVSNGYSVEKISLSIGDIPGNWAQSSCGTGSSPGYLNCVSGASSGPRKPLSLTEVMANPLDEDTGEFIELYNKGIDPIDAAGLLINDGDAIDVIGPYQGGSTVIPAGGYALILDAEYAGQYTFPPNTVLLSTPDTTIGSSLAITDEIRLFEANGVQIIDSFRFPFNPGNGVSAERIDVRAFDSAANWTASSCASGSSPGLNNCSASQTGLPKQLVFTEVMSNQAGLEAGGAGEYVELLNLGDRSVDLRGMFLASGPPGSEVRDQVLPYNQGDTVLLPGAYAVIVDRDYDGRYSFTTGATIVTIDDSNFGASGLATTHALTLYDVDGLTPVARFAYPSDPGDGVSLYRISTTVIDSAANWAATPCNTTAGSGSCPAGGDVTSTTSFWLDKYQNENGIDWYQAIGWPLWYDPICEFLVVCPTSPWSFTYRDNFPAPVAFTFQNPYPSYAVRFTERSSPTDPCTDPCTTATFVVPAGTMLQVPASSLGYYFAITQGPTLNNYDWFGGDEILYWLPPPDGTLAPFTVEVP